MTKTIDTIRLYLKSLDLSDEVIDIYIALWAYGAQTISELSRNAGIERTRIYRILDTLKQTKLIVVEVHYKREMLRAAPIAHLQLLVSQKEQAVAKLKADLPKVSSLLSAYEQSLLPTHVQFYKGEEGIKQLLWNETKAKGTVRCILYNNIQRRFGINYSVSWAQACNKKNIHFRGIISDQFVSDQKQWHKTHKSELLTHWTERYVSPSVFPISYSTVIFDNSVYFYNWKDHREIFGIGIHSQEIASAQAKFFDLLWLSVSPSKHMLKSES